MASIITVPPPPLSSDTDPTSSLSNKAMARAPLCFFKEESFEASMSAFRAQKEEHKLSSLPLKMNSSVRVNLRLLRIANVEFKINDIVLFAL